MQEQVMSKSDLVDTVREIAQEVEPKVSARGVDVIVNETLHQIGVALKAGRTVRISGFGVFEARIAPSRPGRNPKTGEAVQIPARRRVKFRAAAALKE